MSNHHRELPAQLSSASNVLVLENGSSSVRERVHETLLGGLSEEATDVLA